MRRQILTLLVACAAFGATWLGRDVASGFGEPGGASRLISFGPVEAWPDKSERAEKPDSKPADERALPDLGVPSDSVGRLVPRHYGKPATAAAIADYYLYLPPGFEQGGRRKWPVILYLHGRSLRGSDLSLLTRYGLPRYLADGRDLPFIVVAPQLPDGQSWTDTERMAALLEDVLARYPADLDRVYLTGYSMGGGGVWRLAKAHPEMFAAAAPMAALTPAPSPEWDRAFAHLPVRIYHGTADESAPFAGAAEMAASLRRAGVTVELESVEGARHGDLTRVYGEQDLYDWFLAHRR